MKSENLTLNELIDFNEGNINLHGRRLILHSVHAFAQFRKDLIEYTGLEQARCILTRFGYFWGEADAAAMKRIFTWSNLKDLIMAWPKLFSIEGVVKTIVKTIEVDEENKKFFMEVVWHDSAEVMEHVLEFGKTTHPICWIISGYASGFVSNALGKNVYFIENTCVGVGAKVCSAIGKDESSWDKEIKPVLKYFKGEEIKGKIQELSSELKRKTIELARERKKINNFINIPDFMEVKSISFKKNLELALKVAPYDSSVLVTGESGVGKEVLVRFIQKNSTRNDKPFLAINCGALPQTLLESELFGHKAGAFTGAIHDRTGLFEQSNGGTVFLDEIGDITLELQLKLLRVIQSQEFFRVGESKVRKINVRIISATNKDLLKRVEQGFFREDLYYRLRVVEIYIEPLRERTEDILPLSRFFINKLKKKLKIPDLRLHTTTIDYIENYSWPGNIRELENALEHAAILSLNNVIFPECLPAIVYNGGLKINNANSKTLSEVEEIHIKNILESTNSNQIRASEILGISPSTLWRKLKKFSS